MCSRVNGVINVNSILKSSMRMGILQETEQLYLERRRSPCLPASAGSSSSGSFGTTFRGLAFICWSMFFCTGTGMRGNRVENHSSLVRKDRSISPMVIIQPPPAFTSSSYKIQTIGQLERAGQNIKTTHFFYET